MNMTYVYSNKQYAGGLNPYSLILKINELYDCFISSVLLGFVLRKKQANKLHGVYTMSPIIVYFIFFETFFRIYISVSKVFFHPFYLVVKEARFF